MLLTEPFMQRLYERARQTYGDAVTIPPFGPEGFTVRAGGRTICVSLKQDGRIHILIPTALVADRIRRVVGKKYVDFYTPACKYYAKEREEYGHIRIASAPPFNALVRAHTENILSIACGRFQTRDEIENIQRIMSEARSAPGPVYTIDD
jgi:hypothetical protein